jgi:hypothetical protein
MMKEWKYYDYVDLIYHLLNLLVWNIKYYNIKQKMKQMN